MNLIMKDHANLTDWITAETNDYARRVNCRTLPKHRVLTRTITPDNAFLIACLLGMAVTTGLLTVLVGILAQLTPVAQATRR